ncbi:MAG TPA: DUF3034 family protein [Gammaproteobacteria bacterium]|nr:DUF3034 family protein [Gammaproteobacteria bacterium]
MNQNVLKGILAGVSVAALFGSTAAFAASPDTTPQGVGGGVLNPTASVTNPVKALGAGLDGSRHVGKPQFATWMLRMPDAGENVYGIGANMTFWNRLELGIARNDANFKDASAQLGTDNVTTHDVSAKVELLRGNNWRSPWVPSFSVGGIYRQSSYTPGASMAGNRNSDTDYYAVIGKRFRRMPIPWKIDAGVRYTKAYMDGFGGYGNSRAHAWFGNIAVMPMHAFALGYEYTEATRVGMSPGGHPLVNPARWDVYAKWNATRNLSLKAAYLYSGSQRWTSYTRGTDRSSARGGGGMLSVQYAF